MKNRLIISQEEDNTTDRVLEYCRYLLKDSKTIERINREDKILDFDIQLSNENCNIHLDMYTQSIHLPKNKAWFRRGGFAFNVFWSSIDAHPTLNQYLEEELDQISYFLNYYTTQYGGYNEEMSNNKFVNLLWAKEVGLNIPPTLVTTSKDSLLQFMESERKVITKPIHHGHIKFNIEERNKRLVSPGTTVLNKRDVLELEEQFGPSLFQKYIEKEVEIRVFFFGEKLYPMAIFSQNDSQTCIDYRNYNLTNPNRNVPFQFPKAVEEKLLDLFKKLNFNSCSADVILDKKGTFVFLEINPNGQFGWVSKNCNYYLEKIIAEKIIDK